MQNILILSQREWELFGNLSALLTFERKPCQLENPRDIKFVFTGPIFAILFFPERLFNFKKLSWKT